MTNAFIFTLGFDEKFIIRSLLRYSLKENDKIVILTYKKSDEKTQKAIKTIESIVNSFPNKIDIIIEELDVKEVMNSIKKTISILKTIADSNNIIVNLSGGMRMLCYIVLLSCILYLKMRPELNLKIEVELEDFSGVYEIPSSLLKLPSIIISEEKTIILKEIQNGSNTIIELSKKLNKDETTLRRHIYDLEKIGLINVKKRKPLYFEINNIGNIITDLF